MNISFFKKISSIFIVWIGLLYAYIPTYSYSNKERNLSWISLIKRNNWIDNESIIYKKPSQVITDTDSDAESNKQTEPTKIEKINTYLKNTFPEQILIDGIIRQINWKDLIWSRGYKNNKTHIVVHHTANDISKIKTQEEAKSVINSIFRYHTQTNGRWDIGYNFIIDQWWNIYEWRWWWESVIWAHAKYNNASSLGIALLWNFEINEPTEAQLNALTKLSVALTIRYKINIDSEIYAHIEDDHEPYVKDVIRSSFIWHRDTGKTSCPGKNLYNKLPTIRQAIRTQLLIQKKTFPLKKARTIHQVTTPLTIDDNKWSLIVPIKTKSSIKKCISYDTNIATTCKKVSQWIEITVSKKNKKKISSWLVYIDANTNSTNESYRVIAPINWKSDEQLLLSQRRDEYIKKNNIKSSTNNENKFKKQISLEEIKNLQSQDVNVLLYEASTTLSEWKFLCQQCTVTDNKWNVYSDSSFSVIDNGDHIAYKNKSQTMRIDSLTIQPKKADGVAFITNYDRKSYAGIARNNFYGKLTISKQDIQIIGQKKPINKYTIVNSLPFSLYMRGIIESNDSEPIEKIKVMTLLAKNYVTFYLDSAHRHPSIPANTNYNAVDDARIFQKYAWAGVDKTLTKRKSALESTKNEIVTYNNNLAFLPYYTCSAGFTRSAKEKRGRNDTPYLVSVYDPSPCKDFNGHGVWLAGNGATTMANQWNKYTDIIKYFYPWVEIQTY